jgi:predicted nucleotidyltransferase component of viral defense system
MKIPASKIYAVSAETEFNPLVVEKVVHLFHLLEKIGEAPLLKGQFVLKGGTALNLFKLDIPRLSVDIDLNFIGAAGVEGMKAARPEIEKNIQAVGLRAGYRMGRIPPEHAGGKWRVGYGSDVGGTGNIELDINFVHRIPLWEPSTLDSKRLGEWQAQGVKVLDIHELAAGKLAALLDRCRSRDVFDTVQIFEQCQLDKERLRLAFVVYGAMSRTDWRTVSVDTLNIDRQEFTQKLLPVLHGKLAAKWEKTSDSLLSLAKENVSAVLPLRDNEMEFLNRLQGQGKIEPELLTGDVELQKKISAMPMLLWKSQHVIQQQAAGLGQKALNGFRARAVDGRERDDNARSL